MKELSIEESICEGFEKALAREWQGYNNRGAATVDALEDNTQELAFAKGFYRGAKWQKEQDLELTWEDVERIDDISIRLDGTEETKEMSNKEFYQEVLKRFKAQKGK